MNRYPFWRYLLIIVLVVFGVLYALPNLYGEDPAIQVSTQSGLNLPDDTVKNITASLSKQHLTFQSIKRQSDHNVLIRFNDTETQLKAQDVVQATLGPNYVVALNLAPKTPKWLRAIGAHPMKLGLDLRGGIHFLLKVDVAAMLKERATGDIHGMGQLLRESKIRYAGIRSSKKGLTIAFRKVSDRDSALPVLRQRYPNYTYVSLQQDGEPVLSAIMTQQNLTQLKQYAVEQNLTTMRNRVNALGIGEPVIQQQGADQISVDLPGIQDTARAKNIIGKVATIRMQLEDTTHDALTAKRSGIVPFGSTLYMYQNRPVLLKSEVILRGTSITGATAGLDENGRPSVNIRVSGSGVSYFSKVTGENIGKPLAVVYVETKSLKQIVKGKVVTATRQIEKVINIATIQSVLGVSFQVTGLSTMQEAKNLALLLRSGAYTAPVSFVQEQVVGPSLGKKNIEMGVLSCEVGSLLVILFMALYYRLFGLVANFALIMNVIFVVAVMSILGATMTLPGIAGIVLTVGMAVDANVLINERIREELRNGMSPQAAIHSGYDRAFSTIVDANVTTLIVAVVLYALGTGSVQGFAVTLTIGLLTSMITAIFFTRAIINLIYGGRNVNHLSIGIKVKK
ncbi:MAG: protein translocase subunit SecD [Coxiellaceae bacterium]|nr:protein translocase subunit SecD [Coxiellaceae bacterium]